MPAPKHGGDRALLAKGLHAERLQCLLVGGFGDLAEEFRFELSQIRHVVSVP
jgi:hypothetical protein